MTFLGRETSVDGARPVELYHFTSGLRDWYFTSARKQVTYLLAPYRPVAIERSKIEQSKEYNKSNITVTLPGNEEMPKEFLKSPPEGLVTLTIYRVHDGDGEYAVYWTGRVIGTTFGDSGRATIKAEPVYTSLRSQGRRKTYSTQCNWTLYRFGCNVNDQAYKAAGTLASVTGVILGSAAFGTQPDNYFAGGKVVVWVNDAPFNRRVESHTGAVIVMSAPVPGLVAGGIVEVFPGCDHTFDTCIDKFDNSINYGGFPWKPRKDPFSGSSPF